MHDHNRQQSCHTATAGKICTPWVLWLIPYYLPYSCPAAVDTRTPKIGLEAYVCQREVISLKT
jgi:hypothetical protein